MNSLSLVLVLLSSLGRGHPSFEKLNTSTLSKKRGIGALLKTCFGLEGGDTCL